MPIKFFSNISAKQNQQIVYMYNSVKSPTEMPLEYISGKNGGYRISIKSDEIQQYRNYSIYNKCSKQIRWNNNILVGYYNIPEFTKIEKNRLYYAMLQVLGKENVKIFASYSDAILSENL